MSEKRFNPLKVLMVHPHDLWYDPWTIRILELARGLRRKGYEITLCHLPRRERPSHGPLREPLPGDPPIYDLRPKQMHLYSNFRLLCRLAEKCDLLHLQKCFAAVALPILWVSRLLKKPLHYDWDDNETAISQIVESRGLSRFQLRIYEQTLPHFASTLTYSSQAIRERARAIGFPEERMAHLPVGADTERFVPGLSTREELSEFGLDPEKLTILYIGQLEGAAHAHQLINAAPLVLEKAPQTQFLLAGGGEQLDALRTQVANSPARDSLFLPGYVPHERIPALVSASDICVASFDDIPAARAKSPLKIAEYLASGKPIVASRVGEAPYMIDNCGIAVEPDCVQSLADGILTYALDENRRIADGKRARERAGAHFTWERGVETLVNMYSLCVQEDSCKPA